MSEEWSLLPGEAEQGTCYHRPVGIGAWSVGIRAWTSLSCGRPDCGTLGSSSPRGTLVSPAFATDPPSGLHWSHATFFVAVPFGLRRTPHFSPPTCPPVFACWMRSWRTRGRRRWWAWWDLTWVQLGEVFLTVKLLIHHLLLLVGIVERCAKVVQHFSVLVGGRISAAWACVNVPYEVRGAMFLGMGLEQFITAVARCIHLIRIIGTTKFGEVLPNIICSFIRISSRPCLHLGYRSWFTVR